MADTIVIETPVATVLEVSGLQGPQGPTGPQGPAGSVSGSIAWDNVTGKPSLVQSVNGSSGAVTVTPASIDAAEANHDHQPADIYSDAAKVTATTLSAGEPNGVYFRDGSDNGKATYRSAAGYSIFWDDAEGEWVLGNVSQSHKYFIGSQDTTYPWQVSIAWTLGAQGSGTVPTVAQATLNDYQLNAAQDSVSTRVPKSGNATSTQVVLGSDTRLSDSRPATPHTHTPSEVGLGNVSNTAQVTSVSGTAPIVSSGGTTPAISVTVGTTANTVAAGDDSRITGAAQKSANLSDLASASTARTNLGLGTAATAATGDFAAASHSHELTALAATGATNGHVLTANGSNGATFAALPASGVTGAAASASDVLGVSGANITGVDANADRIVFWDDSASALKYLEAGSGLSISGTTMTVTATGGATNLWIPASAWIPRTTGGCGVDSREIGATNRANLDELLFDTGTEEFAQALVVMPSNYNNSTLTARFYWTAASGSGGVAWGISGRAYGDDDALDQASGTRVVVTDTLLATNDVHVTSATSAVTIDGTPAANKAINFQIVREVGNASDTLGVDARLLGVSISFTSA